MTEQQPLLVDEQTAAKMLGLCTKSVYNLRKAGRLPFVCFESDKRNTIRYRVASLKEWVEQNETTERN